MGIYFIISVPFNCIEHHKMVSFYEAPQRVWRIANQPRSYFSGPVPTSRGKRSRNGIWSGLQTLQQFQTKGVESMFKCKCSLDPNRTGCEREDVMKYGWSCKKKMPHSFFLLIHCVTGHFFAMNLAQLQLYVALMNSFSVAVETEYFGDTT